MAGEDLGSAKLILTADDRDLSEKLGAAKKQVDELARQAGVTGDAFSKFFSRNYRLSINDSQLVAANTRLSNLQAKLKEIAASPINVRLNIIEGGLGGGGTQVTPETIQRRFQEATKGGLSGQLTDILAGDIGATRTADLRSTLLARLGRGSLGTGGFNVLGLREVVTQLGGTPVKGRAELLAQAKDLVNSVNDAVIEKVGKDLLDLKLQLTAGIGGINPPLLPFGFRPSPGEPRSPIRGGIGFPGSPGFFAAALPPLPPGFFANRQRDQQRQALARAARNRDIASNALIGGAFPLLFGQGIGASLGGGLGGAGGGAIGGQFGFGLSLLGTAVGAQFDAIIQKATLLGKALRDPIASFGELQQAGLLSSRGLERQVEALIAVGADASAAAVIQRDLANSYGGAEAARAVIESQDQLNRSWSEFSVNLGQLALPVFAAAAEDAASSLSGLVAILRGIGNLELPQIPSRVPDAGALSRSFLRVAAGTAGGGPAGFFNAVGGEVTRLFGRNRPDAQKQAADAVTNAQVRIQRIENLRLATQGKQLKSIAAQAQGYNAIAASLDKDVKVKQKRADILDAERRFGEVQGDRPKADAKRADIQREINRLKDEEVRIQQSYNELAKAAAADSARQLALTKELVKVNPEERGFVQQRFDIKELERQLGVTRAAAAANPQNVGLQQSVIALENQLLQRQLTYQDQLLRYQRDRAATSQLQIANYGLEAQALDRQFAAAKRIAAIPVVGGVSTVRDTAALREGLAEQVADARANEARIAAQIQAEQLRGGDGSAERIQQLQLAQVNAARETRNAAFDAATRLVDAGRSLSQQIKDATRSIRSTLEGSFELLRPGVQRDLLAQARGRINFSLFDVGRVRTPGEIFAAANASESIAQQENIINQANIASAGISKDLVNVNTSLAAATQRLADKNWNVSVNVLGASGAQILGDVVGATT